MSIVRLSAMDIFRIVLLRADRENFYMERSPNGWGSTKKEANQIVLALHLISIKGSDF